MISKEKILTKYKLLKYFTYYKSLGILRWNDLPNNVFSGKIASWSKERNKWF